MNAARSRPSATLRLVAWLLVAGTAGAAPVARAAAVVADVEVRNNYLLSGEQVAGSLGVAAGDPFNAETLEEAIARWNADAALGTVAYRIEPTSDGAIRVVLTVREDIALTALSFEGNRRLSSRRLGERVGLAPGDRVAHADVQIAEQTIRRAYRDLGYAGADVHGAIELKGEAERELVFRVEEGQRTYVKEIVFRGNDNVSARRLRKAMKSKRRRWPGRIWPGWYNRRRFEDDIPRLMGLYRDLGYLDVRVAGAVDFSDDMRRATLRVEIEEGLNYRVAEVVFEGSSLFRDDELLDAVPLQVGGSYRAALVDEALEKIAALYADQGRVDVTQRKGNLAAQPVFAEVGPDVTVRFTIDETPPVYIRRIDIRGLSKTNEHVVRQNLTIYPGQLARASDLRESERLLLNTGFFDRESTVPVAITLEPDEGTMRDAVVEVVEGPTGRLMLGAGIGSDSGVIGELSVVENDFDIANWPAGWRDLWAGNALRGAGQQVSLTMQIGSQSSHFSLRFLEPSVCNTDYSFGAALYSALTGHSEYTDRRTGGSVTVGQRLWKYARRSVTLGYESIEVDDVNQWAARDFLRDEGRHSKPFARVGASIDRRDSRFRPTEGYAAGVDLEVADDDVQTAGLTLRAEKHWPVLETASGTRHALGARARLSVVDTYGDRVPVFERLFAGGMYSLRGFDFEGVSPVDPATRQQVGGEGLLTGSLEYNLPLTSDEKVQLVAFVDAGYVVERAQDVFDGWDELRASTGVGMRWQVPFFGPTTIAVDVASAFLREREDETQHLHFAIGAERSF
jgi:outer membrane protein insertion porin family